MEQSQFTTLFFHTQNSKIPTRSINTSYQDQLHELTFLLKKNENFDELSQVGDGSIKIAFLSLNFLKYPSK